MTKPLPADRLSSPFAQHAPGPRTSNEGLAVPRFSAIDHGARHRGENDRGLQSFGKNGAGISHATVEISPQSVARRRTLTWHGMTAESIDCTSAKSVAFRFRAPIHLLVAYERGERTSGETFVEGLPPSTLRNLARRLTFVPAGREYRECHEPVTHSRLMLFYFDPALFPAALGPPADTTEFAPRLLFEDSALWHAAIKLNSLLEDVSSADRCYFQVLCIVLVYELVRSNRERQAARHQQGGLAGWQQRILTAHIEEHSAERIPLRAMAQLVRLSPYHFCRAFRQSFGVPPHRYQTDRRIQHAKRLLANSDLSITEVALNVGFGSSTSFATAFKKATGLSPTDYVRSL